MRLPIRPLLLSALIALPAGAQTPSADAIREALAKLEAGDLAASISVLERLQEEFPTTPQAQAMLGALYLRSGRTADARPLLEPLAAGANADPAVLFNLAQVYLEADDDAKAEALLERSVARDPVSPAARLLGMRRGNQGNYRDAYRLLRPWALTHPDDLEARIAAVYAALKMRRAPQAAELLEGLPEANPRVALLRARLQLQQGDAAGTIATVKALGARHPEVMDLDVRVLLAEALLVAGQPSMAIEMLDGQPIENAGVALMLSQARHAQGDAAGAADTLAPFVEPRLDATTLPDSPRTRVLQATLAVELGRYRAALEQHAEAVRTLQHATRLRPDDAPAWQLLASSLRASGRHSEAEAAEARFAELRDQPIAADTPVVDPRDPTTVALATAIDQILAGQPEQALATVRGELELSPEDVRLHLMQTRLLLTLGRIEQATVAADRTLAVAPDLPDAVYQRGVVHMMQRDTEAAEQAFRRALEQAPNHLAALNDLALLLITRGESAEAKTLLERVLAVRPDDPVAKERLAGLKPG